MSHESYSKEDRHEHINRPRDGEKEIIEHRTEHLERVIEKEPIHPYRWAALTIWVCAFSAIVIWSVIQTRNNVHAIQQNRKEVIFNNCRNQNMRHDATIIELNKLALQILSKAKNPTVKAQLRRSIRYNIELINAIVPRQDCAKVLQRTLAGQPAPLPSSTSSSGRK